MTFSACLAGSLGEPSAGNLTARRGGMQRRGRKVGHGEGGGAAAARAPEMLPAAQQGPHVASGAPEPCTRSWHLCRSLSPSSSCPRLQDCALHWLGNSSTEQLSTEAAICFCSRIWAFFKKTSPNELDGTCIWAVLLQPLALNAAPHTAAAAALVGGVIPLPQCDFPDVPSRAWGHSLLPFLHPISCTSCRNPQVSCYRICSA